MLDLPEARSFLGALCAILGGVLAIERNFFPHLRSLPIPMLVMAIVAHFRALLEGFGTQGAAYTHATTDIG